MKQIQISPDDLDKYLFGPDLLLLLKGLRHRQGDYGDITITITEEDQKLGPLYFVCTQKGYPG